MADRGLQFQTQETTLHYIVGDQEKEMEYRHRVHSFSTFLETLNFVYSESFFIYLHFSYVH